MTKFYSFLLTFMAFAVVSVSAQTWDFTKGWSDATKANIMADAATWTVNRGTAEAPTGWKNAVAVSGYMKANGQLISELEGLEFTSFAAGNLLLDPSTIRWSKKDQGVIIHGVQNGQTITIKAKSANATAENRNLISKTEEAKYTSGPADGYCYGGSATSETALAELAKAENGFFTLVWTVETENAEGVDVTICCGPNGGIDIQLIKVSGGSADEDKNIAWISGDSAADMYAIMRPTTGLQYTDIAASSEITSDSLRTFDAVVVSTDVAADSPMGKLLAENIAFVPMVNLSTSLFGYIPADVADTKLTAVNAGNEIFAGLNMDENNQFDYINIGVALPEQFASDEVLATCGSAVAMHQHNANRNTYILVPSDAEYNAVSVDAWPILVSNAINVAAATKRDITSAAKPTINESYSDGQTTATLICSTSGSKIYYAIGSGDYQLYTEPLQFTDSLTVSAYAVAEGYNQSGVSTKQITIKRQAAAPSISVAYEEGKAIITMTAEEGATVYFNFTGSESISSCSAYTEAVEVNENCTVTALVNVEGKIASAATSQVVAIPGLKVMNKVLGHFDANKAEWSNGESKTYYYCYLRGNNEKKYNLSEDYTCTFAPEGSEWTLRTSGQQVVWESTSPMKNVGDVSNYNPVRAIDLINNEITSGEVTVGGVGSSVVQTAEGTDSTVNDRPSFELVSNVKYQAPFNIVSYVGAKPGKVGFEYYVSTDGVEWTSIGTSPAGPDYTDSASKWRLWHRDLLSYNGSDAVYISVKSISTDSYRIFDIYVKGEGETDAINEVGSEGTSSSVRKYMQDGQIVIKTAHGTFNMAGARVK